MFLQTHAGMPPRELGAGEVHLSKMPFGEEIFVPLKAAHHSANAHFGDISFVASSGDGEGILSTEGGLCPPQLESPVRNPSLDHICNVPACQRTIARRPRQCS